MIRRDGKIIWLQDRAVSMDNGYGHVPSLQSIAVDIAERKSAEESPRESEEKYRSVFRAAKDAIIITDGETGKILDVNESACSLYGYSQEEMLSMECVALCAGPEERREPAGEVAHSIPLSYHRKKDGAVFPVSISRSYHIRGGRRMHTCVIRDISERIRSERELRLLSARLLGAQEEERKRIAAELHDSIGAMLSAVKYSLENTRTIMEKGAASPECLDGPVAMIQQMMEEARRLMSNLRPSMIDDLGILPTIDWFCRQFEGIYSSIRIDKEIGAEERDVPEALKIIVFRVIQEAFHNIAKHSGADFVKLSLMRDGKTLELLIEDNGIGFDPDVATLTGSTGERLGLTSMRERVELSGGCLSITTASGKGTSIAASWPATSSA